MDTFPSLRTYGQLPTQVGYARQRHDFRHGTDKRTSSGSHFKTQHLSNRPIESISKDIKSLNKRNESFPQSPTSMSLNRGGKNFTVANMGNNGILYLR